MRPTAPPVEPATVLEREAERWIAGYWNADHLLRTRDWLVRLDPSAGEGSRVAALTHDIERHFPGGPQASLADPPDERAYRDAHSRRSAEIVGDWLDEQGATDELRAEVEELILRHEWGGTPAADVMQAADSLSFLEVNAALVAGWVTQGRCSPERGVEQLRWMLERIRLEGARELAAPLFEAAARRLAVAP
jgi:hypothetical protein